MDMHGGFPYGSCQVSEIMRQVLFQAHYVQNMSIYVDIIVEIDI